MFQNSSNGGNKHKTIIRSPKPLGVIKERYIIKGNKVKVGEVRHLRPGHRNHYMTAMRRK